METYRSQPAIKLCSTKVHRFVDCASRGSFRNGEGIKSSNLIAGETAFRTNNTTSSLNHAPGTSSASTAWLSDPNADGLDQRFSDGFLFYPESVTIQNSGYQHPTDHTAFHSIPANPLSHSDTANNPILCYPQDSLYAPPVDDNLAQAYNWSQNHWFYPGEVPPSLQAMTSQPSIEPLPVTTPPQAQPALYTCEWTENGVRCGQPISGDMRKLGAHLGDPHNIHGHETKLVVCLWPGCNQEMQRGGIRRHIASCHLHIQSACEYCSKKYSRRDAMRKHVKQCHA